MKGKSATLKAKEAFMEFYNSGQFAPGSKLPSENEMARILGISRETWRKVLKVLKSEGLLISRHGSGTYVLPRSKQISNDLTQLQSMTKMISDAGVQVVETKANCSVGPANTEICNFFQVPPDTEFLRLERIRYSAEGAICASINYLPARFEESFDKDHLPESLLKHLEDKHAIRLNQAFAILFIPERDDPLLELLELPEGKTAIAFRQFHTDARGNPLLYSLDYLRNDIFQFSVLRTAL